MIYNKEFLSYVHEFTQDLNRLRRNPQTFVPTLHEKANSIGKLDYDELKNLEQEMHKVIEKLQSTEPEQREWCPSETLCSYAFLLGRNEDTSDFMYEHQMDKIEWLTHVILTKKDFIGSYERPADLISQFLISKNEMPSIVGELSGNNELKDSGSLLRSNKFTNFGIAINNRAQSVWLVLSSEVPKPINGEGVSVFNSSPEYQEITQCCTGKSSKRSTSSKIVKKAIKQVCDFMYSTGFLIFLNTHSFNIVKSYIQQLKD